MSKRILSIFLSVFVLASYAFSQDDSAAQTSIQDLQAKVDSLQADRQKLNLPLNISFWGFILGGAGTLLTGYQSYTDSNGNSQANPIYSLPVSIGCAVVAVGGIAGMWVVFDKRGAINVKIADIDSQIDKIKADEAEKAKQAEADRLAAQKKSDADKRATQQKAESDKLAAQNLETAHKIMDALNAKIPDFFAYAKKNDLPLAVLDDHIALDNLNKTLSMTMRQFLTTLYSYKDFLSLDMAVDGKTLTVSYKTYEDEESFTFRLDGNLAYIKVLESQSDFKRYSGSDAENQFVMAFGPIESAIEEVEEK